MICCCCGFDSDVGVIAANLGRPEFMCERCFCDPNLWFSSKRILPHWTLRVKSESVKNRFAKPEPDCKETVVESAFLSKRSRRFYDMSCSLYAGQRTIENYGEGKRRLVNE